MLAGALLVGCTKTTQATTTKKVDPTSQSTTKSTQGTTQPTQVTQAPTQPTQKVKVDLAKPVASVNADETGIVVAPVEHATKIQYKVDDGQYADLPASGVILFSEEKEQHTVLFKAIGDAENYNDSISDPFTYETKAASVTVEKSATNVAAISFEGISLKVNDEASTITSYTATKTEVVKFEVLGGWDDTNHKFYLASEKEVEPSAKETVPPTISTAPSSVTASMAGASVANASKPKMAVLSPTVTISSIFLSDHSLFT